MAGLATIKDSLGEGLTQIDDSLSEMRYQSGNLESAGLLPNNAQYRTAIDTAKVLVNRIYGAMAALQYAIDNGTWLPTTSLQTQFHNLETQIQSAASLYSDVTGQLAAQVSDAVTAAVSGATAETVAEIKDIQAAVYQESDYLFSRVTSSLSDASGIIRDFVAGLFKKTDSGLTDLEDLVKNSTDGLRVQAQNTLNSLEDDIKKAAARLEDAVTASADVLQGYILDTVKTAQERTEQALNAALESVQLFLEGLGDDVAYKVFILFRDFLFVPKT